MADRRIRKVNIELEAAELDFRRERLEEFRELFEFMRDL